MQLVGQVHPSLVTNTVGTTTLSSAVVCWTVSVEAVVQCVDDGEEWCSQQITYSSV